MEQGSDARLLGGCDPRNVGGPSLHVPSVADLVDDAGVQRVAPLAQVRKVERSLVVAGRGRRDPGFRWVVTAGDPDSDNADLARTFVDVDLVDFGGESLVV